MEYTSDSDVSDDTRDLVQQGLATVKRKRLTEASQSEKIRERAFVPNMDISRIRHPLHLEGLNGATSIHGLDSVGRGLANGQNNIHIYICEVFVKVSRIRLLFVVLYICNHRVQLSVLLRRNSILFMYILPIGGRRHKCIVH